MKCSKCGKDFESAYKDGLRDGENCLQRTVNKVLKNNNNLLRTNRYLAQELLNLNDLYPLAGTPSILIPLKKAKQLLRHLNKNPELQTYIGNLIGEQLQTLVDK